MALAAIGQISTIRHIAGARRIAGFHRRHGTSGNNSRA